MRRLISHLALLCLLVGTYASAKQPALSEVTTQSMGDVLKIAKAISVVQPYLDDSKLLEYALGIYQAAKKYGIEPSVIIAITKQETSFREDLPEGAAGEIGITQIRKMWLKQKKFVREFGHRTIKDLKKPSKSFLFTAWLLKDLRGQVKKGSLPYWSFYNAVHFDPRLKYFMAVNKNIVALKKNEHVFSDRAVAAKDKVAAPTIETEEADEVETTSVVAAAPVVAPAAKPSPITTTKIVQPTMSVVAAPAPNTVGAEIAAVTETTPAPNATPEPEKILVPKTRVSSARVAEWQQKARAAQAAQAQSNERPYERLPTNGNRWIPDALLKVQKQQVASETPKSRAASPSVMRAAAELDVKGFFSEKAMED